MKVLDYLKAGCVMFHILYLCLVEIVQDKILLNVVNSDNKIKFLWEKKTRVGLVIDSYMNSDEYIKMKKYFDSLINGADCDLESSKIRIGG